MHAIKIGIIGDFDPKKPSHLATDEALNRVAAHLEIPLEIGWIPTESLDHPSGRVVLKNFQGLWCSPGSPYASLTGALEGIRFCREQHWPFFAT